MHLFIAYWLPVICWMSIIFLLSSRPHFGITGHTLYDFTIFKMLHMIEYAFLYFLVFRALYRSSMKTSQKQLAYAAIFAVLYAISDEIHQRFVPTREGRLRDVFIDFAGILILWTYIKTHFEYVVKHFI